MKVVNFILRRGIYEKIYYFFIINFINLYIWRRKKEYKPHLIRNGEKLLSYNDDADDTEEDEEYDMDEYDSEEENPYYWESYIEDDTVENDMDLYEDPIEDDTEKNMADFKKK